MEKGAAARKALQQGGRFLSDLFKGPQQQQQQHHGGGGDEADEEDALGSSQQAQTHTRALERFLSHVNATMAASSKAKRPPGHQPTLSSSSLSLSASIASSCSSGGAEGEEEEQEADEGEDEGEAAHQPFLLNPTFRAVPMPVLQQHADTSLAVVERIAAYVDDRWRLEAKYARERGRLKLQLFQGGGQAQHEHHMDVLDGLAEAVALFQEVEATQIGATVEEIDQQVRQPLLQLRDTLRAIVQEGRQEQRAIAKEVDGLESRLAKSKAGLARLHERRVGLQSRIEQYRRLLASRRGGSGGGGWEGAHAYPPDTPDPGRVSGFIDDGPSQQAAPAEAQIIPSLERRLFEVEGEMRASEHEIEAQGRLLLDALGRQDRTAARWAHELERADKTRRFALQAAATAYVEAEARATQRNLFQLESLMQLAARVDLEADQQGFIARHRDGAGTAPRTPALRLLEQQQEWEQARQRQRRRQARQQGGDGEEEDEDDSGQWEEVDAPQSPAQHRYGQQQQPPRGSPPPPPAQQQEEEMVPIRTTKSQGPAASASAATTSASSSAASSPARSAREEAVVPSFDEKEDGAVVAAFVQQLFAPPLSPLAPPPPPPSSMEGGKGQEEEGFDWDRLPRATAALASFSFHSTEGERRRFFQRIFAGEDGRGRAAFLAELNLQRSKETNVGAGFDELAQLFWEFLLYAQRNRDVHSAKMGMMLASTFFRPKPQPEGDEKQQPERREFLSRRLQKHPLWRDAAFWTMALQEQVREQLSAMGELLPFGATAWHDAGPEAGADLVARVQNTVFSNAAALAHSMLEFGAPVEDAREFVLRASEQYGLPEEMEHQMLLHLVKREQRYHHHHHHRREQTPPAPAAAPQQEGEEKEQRQQQGDAGAQILEMAQAAATM